MAPAVLQPWGPTSWGQPIAPEAPPPLADEEQDVVWSRVYDDLVQLNCFDTDGLDLAHGELILSWEMELVAISVTQPGALSMGEVPLSAMPAGLSAVLANTEPGKGLLGDAGKGAIVAAVCGGVGRGGRDDQRIKAMGKKARKKAMGVAAAAAAIAEEDAALMARLRALRADCQAFLPSEGAEPTTRGYECPLGDAFEVAVVSQALWERRNAQGGGPRPGHKSYLVVAWRRESPCKGKGGGKACVPTLDGYLGIPNDDSPMAEVAVDRASSVCCFVNDTPPQESRSDFHADLKRLYDLVDHTQRIPVVVIDPAVRRSHHYAALFAVSYPWLAGNAARAAPARTPEPAPKMEAKGVCGAASWE